MNKIGMDMFEEKNLWTIYRTSVRKLPVSKFNAISTTLSLLLLAAYCVLFPEKSLDRVGTLRTVCELGLGFGSTILGFLIAGFTIFATITKPELFVLLYYSDNTKANLNYLKTSFFAFVEVFVVYITFLVLCLFIKLVGSEGGFIASLVSLTEQSSLFSWRLDKRLVIDFAYVFMGTLSLYTLLALKSFVYNIYHTVIVSIVWILNSQKNDEPNSGAK